LGDLIDACAMRGGYFDLGSAAYTMTRLATGQLDAYVDPGHWMLATFPELEAAFREVGDGALCTNFPYDVAAAQLIVQEAGGVVSGPDGTPLDDLAAVGSGEGFGLSVVASASGRLHEHVLAALAEGMTRLGAWLSLATA
jgi:myo-inositol-1(or 4)-monophosphatase